MSGNPFHRLRQLYRRHELFALILLLFVSFRVLAILLFRPGGFVTDFSDFDYYYAWGELEAMGHRTWVDLWNVYPPLFTGLMLWIFRLAAAIPRWVEPRLFFHVLLAGALLLFDTGNLVLLYRLARRLAPEVSPPLSAPGEPSLGTGLRAPLLYALFFAPVYTLLGWFEVMPLFFLLLGLDLLLSPARWGWLGSAVAAGLGFLTKLTPALLVPVAVRWLGARLSWDAARREWFRPTSPGNLGRPGLYVALFLATVVLGWAPFARHNPSLALAVFRIQAIRPPWQSLWALLDGYTSFGWVPLDLRNLQGLEGVLWESRLPWGWITLAFALVYLWLYTRPFAWERPRTVVAFTGVSLVWLFLYSKGWSPQFVVWLLAFIALLLPNLRGVMVAIALTLLNFVEADVYLILLPEETGLLWATVLLRTGFLLLLAGEFLGLIWPQPRTRARLGRISAQATWALLGVSLLAGLLAAPRMAQAYRQRRLAEHPCPGAVAFLEQEAEWPNRLIVAEQIQVWHAFYPWLRQEYAFRILDSYGVGQDPAQVVARRLAPLAAQDEFWWIQMEVPELGPLYAPALFPDFRIRLVEERSFGACTLARAVPLPEQPLASADVAGGPILLLKAVLDRPAPGEALHLVLYWQAQAPVQESYTVFTQLLDEQGRLVAQQDNLPVTGLAPTETWQPGLPIRDPYRLAIPPDASPGRYRLLVGLYTAAGRRPLLLADGRQQEFVEFPITLE